MTDMHFDTQKMVERLEETGVPPAQARVHTALLVEAIHASEAKIIEHCASKEDLARMEARIDARFDRLEGSTDARFDKVDARFEIQEQRLTGEIALVRAAISDTKSELMKWVVTVGILQMALIAGLVLKLAP